MAVAAAKAEASSPLTTLRENSASSPVLRAYHFDDDAHRSDAPYLAGNIYRRKKTAAGNLQNRAT
jgi:hypothetical protein